MGKTTIAVNTAVLLAQTKKKVAMVDLIFSLEIFRFFKSVAERTIAELAQEGSSLDIDLLELMIPHLSGIKSCRRQAARNMPN